MLYPISAVSALRWVLCCAVPCRAVLCCADVAFGLCTYVGGYSGVPVDDQTQCVSAAGFDHKLCMAWRQDNAGPHSAEEVCFAVVLLLPVVYTRKTSKRHKDIRKTGRDQKGTRKT
jgi:hypothetical protein